MNQRNALIVWGGWEGHQPEQCAAVVESFLLEDGFVVAKENQTNVFRRSGSGTVRLDYSDLDDGEYRGCGIEESVRRCRVRCWTCRVSRRYGRQLSFEHGLPVHDRADNGLLIRVISSLPGQHRG